MPQKTNQKPQPNKQKQKLQLAWDFSFQPINQDPEALFSTHYLDATNVWFLSTKAHVRFNRQWLTFQ